MFKMNKNSFAGIEIILNVSIEKIWNERCWLLKQKIFIDSWKIQAKLLLKVKLLENWLICSFYWKFLFVESECKIEIQ